MQLQQNWNVFLPTAEFPSRSFRILNKIAEGGEGKVYKATPVHWGSFQQDVALKLMPLNKINQSEQQLLEMLIDQQNSEHESFDDWNSSIVKVFDVAKYFNHLVIIMELGDESLFQKLDKQQRMPMKEQISILLQLSRSIKFLHDNKIIHCDVKPENFVKFGNEFKLIDFGKVTKEEEKQIIIGTQEFTPPEILNQSAYCTFKTDIWSLGATFFEILTYKPFSILNVYQNNYSIISLENQPIPQDIEIKYKKLLYWMLHKNPQSRIDIGTVIRQLEQIQIEINQLSFLMTVKQEIINSQIELFNQFNEHFQNILDQKIEQIKQEQQNSMNSQTFQKKNEERKQFDSGEFMISQALTDDTLKSSQIINFNEIIQDVKQNCKETKEIKFNLQTQEQSLKNLDLKSTKQHQNLIESIQSLSQSLYQPQQQIIIAKIQDSLTQNFQELKQFILKEVNNIHIGITDKNFSAGNQIQNNVLDRSSDVRQKSLQKQQQLQKILRSLTQQTTKFQELRTKTQNELSHENSKHKYQNITQQSTLSSIKSLKYTKQQSISLISLNAKNKFQRQQKISE